MIKMMIYDCGTDFTCADSVVSNLVRRYDSRYIAKMTDNKRNIHLRDGNIIRLTYGHLDDVGSVVDTLLRTFYYSIKPYEIIVVTFSAERKEQIQKHVPYVEAVYVETEKYRMLNDFVNGYHLMCKPLPEKFGPLHISLLPVIKDVMFNPPATIVTWKDGTKTVVKASEGDPYDPEKGLAMAFSRKALGNKYEYYNTFLHWLKKAPFMNPPVEEDDSWKAVEDIDYVWDYERDYGENPVRTGLSIEQYAKEHNISTSTVRRRIKAGKLKTAKLMIDGGEEHTFVVEDIEL